MLREITVRRGLPGTGRRWFTDTDMDLYVWLDKQMPVRFQLAYNKQKQERALSWDRNIGFTADQVDDGDTRNGRYKMSALFLPASDQVDIMQLAARFLRASEQIDPMLADFIYARLLEYPRQDRRHANPRIAPARE